MSRTTSARPFRYTALPREAPDSTRSEQPLRVLCVDPDRRVADVLAGLLESEGFRVDTAHDGRRALRLALAGRYDAIVMEPLLPGITGLEILKTLRRDACDTPVVLLAGTPSIDAAVEATRLQAIYATKSGTTLSQVVAAIRDAAPADAGPSSALFAKAESFDLERVLQRPGTNRGATGAGAIPRLLLRGDLTFPQFLLLAAAVRTAAGEAAISCQRHRPWTAVQPLAREAVLRIEQAGVRWASLTAETLATELSIRPAAVWRLLHEAFGAGFLVCRRAVVMRRAVGELGTGREQVAQIAYRLGYDHASSFNRDFRRFLRHPPTAFRRLMRDETDKE